MANTTTNNFFPITNDKLNDISRGESFVDFAGLNYFWTLAKQYIDNGDSNADIKASQIVLEYDQTREANGNPVHFLKSKEGFEEHNLNVIKRLAPMLHTGKESVNQSHEIFYATLNDKVNGVDMVFSTPLIYYGSELLKGEVRFDEEVTGNTDHETICNVNIDAEIVKDIATGKLTISDLYFKLIITTKPTTEVYTTDFEIGLLIRGRAVATRELLNAVQAGKIIKVKDNNKTGGIILNCEYYGDILCLNTIYNNYLYRFTADFSNNVETTTINAGYDAITTAPDWFENYEASPNYIANRTHYPNIYGRIGPGQRYSITDSETTHDLNNYRLLVRGELFKIQEGEFTITKDDAYITFNCVRSESGKAVTWTLSPAGFSGFEENEYIQVVSKLRNYKALDEFYLPDTIGRVYRTEFTFDDMQKTKVITITRELVEAIMEKKIIVIPCNNALGIGGYIANCYCRKDIIDGNISGYLDVIIGTNRCYATIKLLNSEIRKATNVIVTELQPALRSGNNIKTINGSSILGSGNIELITDIESIPVSDIEALEYIE